MNQDNQVGQTPNFEGEPMKMPENNGYEPVQAEKSEVVNGPLLLILTVLLIVILGGMYYWFSTLNSAIPEPAVTRPTPEMNNEPESTTAEAQVETMQAVSTSDELSAIEADVEATNLDTLDAEMNAIDAELDAAI